MAKRKARKREVFVVEERGIPSVPFLYKDHANAASAYVERSHVTRYIPEDAGTRVWVIEQAGVGVWYPTFVHDSEAAALKDIAVFTKSKARIRSGRIVLDPVETDAAPVAVSVPVPKRVTKDRMKAAKARRGGA